MRKWIIFLVLLAIGEISIALYLTHWSHQFWQSVGDKVLTDFYTQLGYFTIAALIYCFISGMSVYVARRASVEWSKILYENTKNREFSQYAFDNIPQRIENDINVYPQLAIGLIFGFMKAFGYIVVFSIALCTQLSYIYVIILSIYTVIGFFIGKKVAQPLIKLNYNQQAANATFRREIIQENFQKCVHLWLGVAVQTKKLTYFSSFWGQLSVILPLILIAPAYFGTAMTLGALMQGVRIMNTLLENLLYPLNSFGNINDLLASRKRLKEIDII